jgi:hypothetical protein
MRWILAAGLFVLALVGVDRGADTDTTTADEQTLRAANLPTDPLTLLEFFRKRTPTEADGARVATLIKQLGADEFETREKAGRDLVAFGPRVIPLLRRALMEDDREVVRRAEECVRQIETREKEDAGGSVPLAVARLVAARKPVGAAEVVLNYLSVADHPVVVEELQTTLAAVAVREGNPEPVLLAALTATDPLKRGFAGSALARAGLANFKPALRKLLQDPEPGVRLRVALGLVAGRDKEGVPVLIDLLGRLPQEQGWQAEEVLQRLAGEKSPAVSLGKDVASRGKCRDAWATWWRDNEGKVDLANLDAIPPRLGYTLVAVPDAGTVYELDREGKVRWQINQLQTPMDARILPGGRVLIAEYSGRVTERNLKGDVLWEKAVPSAMHAQRLPDGNTFVVNTRQLLLVDPAGKETTVYTHNAPGSIIIARKLRNGQIVVVNSDGACIRLNATGNELSRFAVGKVSNNCLDVLPNGNILIAKYFDGKVTEYSPQGAVVWEVPQVSAFSVQRLPSGNTLVACHQPAQVVELNPAGKVVWKYDAETANHRPWFASRR